MRALVPGGPVAQSYPVSVGHSVGHAVEAERARLRQDLHDGLGPLLSGIGLCAHALSDRLGGTGHEVEHALLERIRSEVVNAVAELRRLIDARPPAAVEAYGLVDAVRRYVRSAPPAAAVELVATALPPLPPALEAAAYRIVTEALTNVVRHADARLTRVTLTAAHGSLLIGVADDGRGIASPPGEAGLGVGPGAGLGVGLGSMRRRAESLGGTLSIRTAPGDGTEVTVVLPLP
ncbi:sensor histidine kinase [Streptomyces geranii]|uniref:sensor histidine kinase n=1 Tax=Streptomyces geranii TaxID=2058923 RepID=UPI0018E567F8|nr:sensor histidine kinase [Streptomyces geranii]